ncbi:DUF3108 domain-containing protein [Bizionia argentinensis]|uniref:DUF3108 domain-containing protein n=1 Tax=Bizionia argentinensis TaxID=456455 RepID=UPI002934C3F7|nr:DUF3108 domain-containing protein [Bizionia argentinensis]
MGNSNIDIVTTIYKIRNFNLDQTDKGKGFPLSFIFDNKEFKISAVYLGTEIINTGIGKKECNILDISVANSSVLKGSNDNLLWLTTLIRCLLMLNLRLLLVIVN